MVVTQFDDALSKTLNHQRTQSATKFFVLSGSPLWTFVPFVVDVLAK